MRKIIIMAICILVLLGNLSVSAGSYIKGTYSRLYISQEKDGNAVFEISADFGISSVNVANIQKSAFKKTVLDFGNGGIDFLEFPLRDISHFIGNKTFKGEFQNRNRFWRLSLKSLENQYMLFVVRYTGIDEYDYFVAKFQKGKYEEQSIATYQFCTDEGIRVNIRFNGSPNPILISLVEENENPKFKNNSKLSLNKGGHSLDFLIEGKEVKKGKDGFILAYYSKMVTAEEYRKLVSIIHQ